MKAFASVAIVVGALGLAIAVAETFVAIWTGDDRWAASALMAFIVSLCIGGFGIGARHD